MKEWWIVIGLGLVIGIATPVGAFLAPSEFGDVVQTMLRADVLPRFEACPGLVYGIEAMETWEDPDYPAIRYWVVTIVLTVPALSGVEGPVLSGVEGPALSGVEGPALSGVEGREPHGLALIEEDLMFRAMPGLDPRLIAESTPVAWPH